MKIERRYFPIEIRADVAPDAPATLTGYAAVFGELSQVIFGMFREKIERGAFAASLGGDIKALWNHDTNLPLGRTKSGTLKLAEDTHGLRVEINPPDTQAGRDALESIRRGDVDQMSFGFQVLEDTWDKQADGMVIRTQPLGAASVAKARALKIVSRHGVGYDAVDVPALNARGIPLCIVGDVNSSGVAEHAMMLILAATHRLIAAQHISDCLSSHIQQHRVELRHQTRG